MSVLKEFDIYDVDDVPNKVNQQVHPKFVIIVEPSLKVNTFVVDNCMNAAVDPKRILIVFTPY